MTASSKWFARRRKTSAACRAAIAVAVTVGLSFAAVGSIAGAGTEAATYYVDSSEGSDANSGTTSDAAWRTLAKAARVPLEPGDSILLRRGGNWVGSLRLSHSGTVGAPIVVSAYGTGPPPVLQSGPCVDLVGSYIALRNLHLHNCSWAGVSISGHHNTVESSLVTDNVTGIYVRSGAVGNRVMRNELRNNNRMSVLTADSPTDDSGAFGILLRGDHTEVAHNVISGSDAFSYDYGRDGAAIEVYGGIGNRIHRNLAVDNNMFTELGHSRSADNAFSYNVVHSRLEQAGFLTTRGSESRYGPVMRTRVHNNSVLLTGGSSHGVVCHGGCGTELLHMRNNLVQAVRVGWADSPFDEDYGIYFGERVQFVLGPHSRIAEPGFVDPGLGDLHLQRSSVGVDAGVGIGYRRDFDGTPVPRDGDGDGVAVPDIGAFERPSSYGPSPI